MRRLTLNVVVLAVLALVAGTSHAVDLTWFEWSAISPVVVVGEALGEKGPYAALRVERAFRGAIAPGGSVLIDLRVTNRSRNRELYPKATRLEPATSYAVLLEPSGKREGEQVVYSMVRGVKGVRPLPPEGAPAVLQALARFVAIQDTKSESAKWRSFTEMLDEGNPILLANALQQFLKFRRGTPELGPSVVPLLNHPLAPVRERAAVLIGQIVATYGSDRIPEEQTLRGELFALARRDPAVQVRMAACRALGGFPDRGVEEVLREIAEKDPEQDVRYEAEKLLYERSLEAERAGRR